VAQLALAPLAPADYVIEIAEAGETGGADAPAARKRTLLGFRVIP
jgi:hypothetical protein